MNKKEIKEHMKRNYLGNDKLIRIDIKENLVRMWTITKRNIIWEYDGLIDNIEKDIKEDGTINPRTITIHIMR